MKKFVILFVQGIGLGLAFGLCIAGALALVFRAIHSGDAQVHYERSTIYFLVVGSVMGLISGWCLSLQMILSGLLSTLFMKISALVPMPAAQVTEEWARKMEIFFKEVLQPMPSFFHKIVDAFLVVRFRDYARVNRALEKAKRKEPTRNYSPEWMSQVALNFFLEPLWLFFYVAYVILFVISCVFWSFAFFR